MQRAKTGKCPCHIELYNGEIEKFRKEGTWMSIFIALIIFLVIFFIAFFKFMDVGSSAPAGADEAQDSQELEESSQEMDCQAEESLYDELASLDESGQTRDELDHIYPDLDEDTKANMMHDLYNGGK